MIKIISALATLSASLLFISSDFFLIHAPNTVAVAVVSLPGYLTWDWPAAVGLACGFAAVLLFLWRQVR